MAISYEAHPLNHGGEAEVTVQFSMPSGASSKERTVIMTQAADEVARRERVAGIIPLEQVVFTAHDDSQPQQRRV